MLYVDGFEGLKYEIKLIDIEAAFPGGEMEKPTYI
jgi:hypothetical protein